MKDHPMMEKTVSPYEQGFRDALRSAVAFLGREADLDPDPSGGNVDRPNWAMRAATEIERHFAMDRFEVKP